jgi:hypothetical protein
MKSTKSGLNTISSVYGKDNIGNFIYKNIQEHSTIYVDEKKALDTIRPNELQLLKEDSAKNLLHILSHNSRKKSSDFDENSPLFQNGIRTSSCGSSCSWLLPSSSSPPTLAAAQTALTLLSAAFPGAVYPQFVRMKENESQLEAFYRHYKEKGKVLIQKYNWFCGKLPDRKPADLSPLERRFCWHQMRDMVILLDGSVPLCKESAIETVGGDNAPPPTPAPEGTHNIFDPASGGITGIWEKLGAQAHLDSLPICKDCDEYYTFNF